MEPIIEPCSVHSQPSTSNFGPRCLELHVCHDDSYAKRIDYIDEQTNAPAIIGYDQSIVVHQGRNKDIRNSNLL